MCYDVLIVLSYKMFHVLFQLHLTIKVQFGLKRYPISYVVHDRQINSDNIPAQSLMIR